MYEDDVIRSLLDAAFKAEQVMLKTHHKEDIIRFINIARELDSHGYSLQWYKYKGCVRATRKDVYVKPTSA